jgi:hypothetical protein
MNSSVGLTQAAKTEIAIKKAKKHIFSTGMGDVSDQLARTNMLYGLAKIHTVQEQFGMVSNAVFIGAPDCTVTRNRQRWADGFGYGGKVIWGKGNESLVFLDAKPNACGMLVGALEEAPTIQAVMARIQDLVSSEMSVEGIPLQWDFGVGNHFIDLFSISTSVDYDSDLPPFAFIIHGSGDEIRADRDGQFGLYWDKSAILQETMSLVPTQFGNAKILLDTDARRYYRFCQFANRFTIKRREKVAQKLFNRPQVITNVNHQKLVDMNTMILGTHDTRDSDATERIFPVCLRSDLPAFLFRGLDNLSLDVIEALGFTQRALSVDVMDYLREANILPHGSGYEFPNFISIDNVFELNSHRYFVLDAANGVSQKVIEDARNIQFSYRGRSIIIRIMEYALGKLLVRLKPLYTIKV